MSWKKMKKTKRKEIFLTGSLNFKSQKVRWRAIGGRSINDRIVSDNPYLI